ncbi:MAG: DUF1540 domain-containing protein [Clostridia bacterium]|nr:DUF1540 domain-containing protein [Clostridia bacterium]
MPDVKCSIDSCKYWGVGQVCHADSIWVQPNTDAGGTRDLVQSTQMEFAVEPGAKAGSVGTPKSQPSAPGSRASNSAQTRCGTMTPRDTNADHGKHDRHGK